MKIALLIICPTVAFISVYLLGSFACASFNIKEWSEMARYSIALIGGIASLYAFVVPLITVEVKSKTK